MAYPPASTPISASVPVIASITPPISTPTIFPTGGGSFTVNTSTHIPITTPSAALAFLLDTTKWSSWNTFCPQATLTNNSTGIISEGTELQMDVHMDGSGLKEGAKKSRVVSLVVTKLEDIEWEGKRVAWKNVDYPGFMLRSERVFEFVADGEGGTTVTCWETFAGLLAPVVKMSVGGTLVARLGDYMHDLRGHFAKDELQARLLQEHPVVI